MPKQANELTMTTVPVQAALYAGDTVGELRTANAFIYDHQLMVVHLGDHFNVASRVVPGGQRIILMSFHNVDDAVAAINELERANFDWTGVVGEKGPGNWSEWLAVFRTLLFASVAHNGCRAIIEDDIYRLLPEEPKARKLVAHAIADMVEQATDMLLAVAPSEGNG